MGGDRDPIAPITFSETIAASLPRHVVRFERFTDCGHGMVPDVPEKALSVLRRGRPSRLVDRRGRHERIYPAA